MVFLLIEEVIASRNSILAFIIPNTCKFKIAYNPSSFGTAPKLSENREPILENSFWPGFPIILVK